MSNLFVRVIRKKFEAEGIASFLLRGTDSTQLPPFSAGAHIDVHIPGSGLVRQYSLCNSPQNADHYLIGVLRDPGSRGGSRAMHENVAEGDTLEISPPRNHFPIVPAPHSILLAGGIGMTPLLCMAETLSQSRASLEMHYCTRGLAFTAFRDHIAASSFAHQVHYHCDDGPDAQKLDVKSVLSDPPMGTHVYICGPAGFIDHVRGAATTLGWPAGRIHQEYFSPVPIDIGNDHKFMIRLARSGGEYAVLPGVSIVATLAGYGITIPTSCEVGTCGTCVTPILEGQCDHRDMFLTDEEKARNDRLTVCCSRALSPMLVLDI